MQKAPNDGGLLAERRGERLFDDGANVASATTAIFPETANLVKRISRLLTPHPTGGSING